MAIGATDRPNVEDRKLGAIYGHLVGDAFGVPFEFRNRSELPDALDWRGWGTYHQPPGTWSDDGAMMLCLLASLQDRGKFDPVDLGRRFVAWLDHGYMAAGGVVFDVGRTTRRAIENLRRGIAPLAAGLDSEKDNGNGSLMRVLPLVLWASALHTERFILLMHECSRITHGHPCSQVCCAVYGLMVRHFLNEGDQTLAWQAAVTTAEELYQGSSLFGAGFVAELERLKEYRMRTGSGFVLNCLHSAWQAVTQAHDFSSAIREAVRFGNDTDTTAAVAGSLAGAKWGVQSIPAAWRDGLRLDHEQRNLISAFARLSDAGSVAEL